MKHSFIPSNLDNTKCQKCKYNELQHGNNAPCEFCDFVGECDVILYKRGGIISTALVCPTCAEKNLASDNLPEDVKEIVIRKNETDNKIQYLPDFFNSETVAIAELKEVIYSSDIENKPFILASQLMERFNHYKQVLFNLNQEIVEKVNKQRATQQALNELANQLREEERKQLQIADINYKPVVNEKVSKPKAIKTKKFDKKELAEVAKELNLSGKEYMIQMVATAKNISVREAAIEINMTISAAKG